MALPTLTQGPALGICGYCRVAAPRLQGFDTGLQQDGSVRPEPGGLHLLTTRSGYPTQETGRHQAVNGGCSHAGGSAPLASA